LTQTAALKLVLLNIKIKKYDIRSEIVCFLNDKLYSLPRCESPLLLPNGEFGYSLSYRGGQTTDCLLRSKCEIRTTKARHPNACLNQMTLSVDIQSILT